MKNLKLKNLFVLIFSLMLFVYDAYGIIEILQVSNATSTQIYVPIIMYHNVKSTQLGKDTITQSEFESDLKYLSENNYNTITMTQLINYVYSDEELPPNPIILTFDD